LSIFDQKIENSNIDLLTYLNNLNYFNTEPVTALPNLNLSEDALLIEHEPNTKQHGWLYYSLWGIGNIVLILVFAFQILWFNPKLMHESPALNRIFNYALSRIRNSLNKTVVFKLPIMGRYVNSRVELQHNVTFCVFCSHFNGVLKTRILTVFVNLMENSCIILCHFLNTHLPLCTILRFTTLS